MADFEMSRATHVAADPATVHALIDDFRQWTRWSPWEGADPDLRRTYGGPEVGVGSTYHWSGNKKAGEGRMEITSSNPTQVVVDLEFVKPFKATNVTIFSLRPSEGGTDVTWTMTGQRSAVMGLMGRLFFDTAIGKDFDKGLAAMKQAAERG
ncbi:MAG: SRPBCC family protein [Janibacter sp.]|nr:SRPBCC family protein [Janibacter sp.]